MNETVPVCLAIDKIRPATPDEALAHLYLHGHRMKDDIIVCPDDEQVKFINEVHPRGKRGFYQRDDELENDDDVSEVGQTESTARSSGGWQLHGSTWKRRAVEAGAEVPVPETGRSPKSIAREVQAQ